MILNGERNMKYSAGDIFAFPYPFVREKYNGPIDGDWSIETMTWRPGVIHEIIAPGDDTETIAHAMGEQVLTVVSVHKPGQFPTRVFYTRQWRSPDGNLFGNGRLHIKTAQAFGWLLKGYRHEYRLEPETKPLPPKDKWEPWPNSYNPNNTTQLG